MALKIIPLLTLALLSGCAPPPEAEPQHGIASKAKSAAETDATLPPITTHKGYKCKPAKVTKPNLGTHRECEPGFSATTQAEPGHCVKTKETDTCETGYSLTYKVVAHYDINVWNEQGEPTCRHIEEDKGLKEVADCR